MRTNTCAQRLSSKMVVGGVEFRHFYYTESGRPGQTVRRFRSLLRVSRVEERMLNSYHGYNRSI